MSSMLATRMVSIGAEGDGHGDRVDHPRAVHDHAERGSSRVLFVCFGRLLMHCMTDPSCSTAHDDGQHACHADSEHSS